MHCVNEGLLDNALHLLDIWKLFWYENEEICIKWRSFLLCFQMFWLLEHPHEKARMQGFQRQVLSERDHFVHHVFNLTSALSNREMQNVKLHLLNSKNMIDPDRGKNTHFRSVTFAWYFYIAFTFVVAFAIPKFCLDLLPFAKWNCEIATSFI